MVDGELVGADLHFEGSANQRRGRADVASKVVLTHHHAQYNGTTATMLAA